MTKKPVKQNRPTTTRPARSARVPRNFGSLLVQTSPDALVALTPDGTVLFWNTGAETIYGYRQEEVLGARLGDWIAPAEAVQEYTRVIADANGTDWPSRNRSSQERWLSDHVDITAKAVRRRKASSNWSR